MFWGTVEVWVRDDERWDELGRAKQEAAVVQCRQEGPCAVRVGKTLVAELTWVE